MLIIPCKNYLRKINRDMAILQYSEIYPGECQSRHLHFDPTKQTRHTLFTKKGPMKIHRASLIIEVKITLSHRFFSTTYTTDLTNRPKPPGIVPEDQNALPCLKSTNQYPPGLRRASTNINGWFFEKHGLR